jgi:hypothetical protein
LDSTAFESRVFQLLVRLLRNSRLGLVPTATLIYHQRPYYSADRQSDIVVDVAIEAFRYDAQEPFLVWVWECKSYSHAVPVDDVEEFNSKLLQLGSSRFKGTVVTTSHFQRSAVLFARAHKIGLVRLPLRGRMEWLVESPSPPRTAFSLLCNPAVSTPSSFSPTLQRSFDSVEAYLYEELSALTHPS